MKVKALISFCGSITMCKGEIKDITDKETLNNLLKVGYVEKLASKSTKKVVDEVGKKSK